MGSAVESLERAFRSRCPNGDGTRSTPRVGLFGDGLPEALIVAAGGLPVEVKAPPSDDALAGAADAIASVIEDFVDPYAARFLHRLAAGWYREHAAIAFSRDDVAALTAYQYATELRRQGIIPSNGPSLLLWNLVHDQSDAAHRFNMIQADRLLGALSALLGTASDEDRMRRALVAERDRQEGVARAEARGLVSRDALVWRNAGRWLPAAEHASLIEGAMADRPSAPDGPRIGLVGTAIIEPEVHAMLDTVGPVVADLQPYGAVWPACHAGGPELDGLIRHAAGFPLHLRAAPPARFRRALLDRLAGCDLVVSQVCPSDDGFGWEVPGLRDALAARGVPLVDLGFRPFRPDGAWIEASRRNIVEAGVAA